MKTIIILFMLCCALPVMSADIPDHTIKIVPGQPWSMVVQFRFAVTAPVTKPSNYYLAFVRTGPLTSDVMVARMYVEVSAVDATAVHLSLTDVQTAALTGKGLKWSLVYLPDIGPATLISKGKVEVNL